MASLILADEERSTSIGLTTKFAGEIPSGKNITYMSCGVPSCDALSEPLQKAIDHLGWTLKTVNTGATPAAIKASWNALLQNPPDGVITIANPSSLFQTELTQLAKMGVPVIAITATDKPGETGFAAVFNDPALFKEQGEALARNVIANGGPEASVVLVQTNAIPTVTMMQEAFATYLTANCAGCSVDRLQVALTDLGAKLPPMIVGYLRAHPKTKWVYTAFVDMNAGLPAALESSGLQDVNVLTYNTDATTVQYMQSGQNVVAAMTNPGAEYMYRSADFLLRHFAGESTEESQATPLPLWLVTRKNLPANALDSPVLPIIVDIDAQYAALWGVK